MWGLLNSLFKERTAFEIYHLKCLNESRFMSNVKFILLMLGLTAIEVFASPYLNSFFQSTASAPFSEGAGYIIVANIIGTMLAIPIFLFIDIRILRNKVEKEKNIAESRKREWTENFRKTYVTDHREEILKNAKEILKKYEEIVVSNGKRIEYYNKYVSPEVVKMWNEDYERWFLASGGKNYEVERTKRDEPRDKIEIIKKELENIRMRVEFEKLTIEGIKSMLNNANKEWSKQYGSKEAGLMVEQLEQRVSQFMNKNL